MKITHFCGVLIEGTMQIWRLVRGIAIAISRTYLQKRRS